MSRILKINRHQPEKEIIDDAAAVVRDGGIIVAPTETRYGLIARADDPQALKRLYFLKKRDFSTPCSVFVDSYETALRLGHETKYSRKLAVAFLPGPLTLVLKNKSTYPPPIVTDGCIGFRVSSSSVIGRLLDQVKVPLTATSANLSGSGDCETIDEIFNIFGSEIDLYLDSGPLDTVTSTVVTCLGEDFRILRQGAIPEKEILEVIGGE